MLWCLNLASLESLIADRIILFRMDQIKQKAGEEINQAKQQFGDRAKQEVQEKVKNLTGQGNTGE
jgi:hypothetical protein